MSAITPVFRPASRILTNPNRRFLNEVLGAGAERLVQSSRPLKARIAREYGPGTDTYVARSILDQIVPNLIHGEEGLPLTALASGKVSPGAARFIAMIGDPTAESGLMKVLMPDYAKDIANLALVNQGSLMRTARSMGERALQPVVPGLSPLDIPLHARREIYSSAPNSPWSYNRYEDPRMEEYFELTGGPTQPMLLGDDPRGLRGLYYGDVPIISRALREMTLRGMVRRGDDLDTVLPLWRTQQSIGTGGQPGRTGGILSFTSNPDDVLAAYDVPAFQYDVPVRRVTFAGPEVFRNDIGEYEYQALADGLSPVQGPQVFSKGGDEFEDFIENVPDELRYMILRAAQEALAGRPSKLPSGMADIISKNAEDIVEIWG